MNPNCPKCDSSTVKNGKRRGKQSYKCQHCNHQFIDPQIASTQGRKPPDYKSCPRCKRAVLKLVKGHCMACYMAHRRGYINLDEAPKMLTPKVMTEERPPLYWLFE